MANYQHRVKRKWVHIEEGKSATSITFECGHVSSDFNPAFNYRLDPEHFCFKCERALDIAEAIEERNWKVLAALEGRGSW